MRDFANEHLTSSDRLAPLAWVIEWLKVRRYFLLIVVLPTIIVAAYYLLIASDQYESEAHFMVRSSEQSAPVASGLGQVLEFATGGGGGGGQSESMSVGDYLKSHDAVAALRKNDQLVERFRRSNADPISQLGSANPKAETLLKYYRKHVDIDTASDTGLTTLKVRTFSPEDSFFIINALLKLGEERVNELNARLYQDTLAVANREVEDAEAGVTKTQGLMTGFRQSNSDIDPAGAGEAQIRLVSELTAALSSARAQLASMKGTISPSSPQYVALAARVRALEGQVGAQSGLMANNSGGAKTIATDLGSYEELRMRQDFAAKRYAAAAAALEQARERATKQQLYIVRVVEPNLPDKSTYPKRWTSIATVFFGLLLAYGIGWLILAGVREHAA